MPRAGSAVRATVVSLLTLVVALPLLAQKQMPRSPTRPIPRAVFADPPREYLPAKAHSGPIPFPEMARKWIRIDTPNYVVISSASDRRTRVIATDLERFTTMLLRTSPLFQRPGRRTRVFLFSSRREVQPYFDVARGGRVNAAGITLRHPDGSVMIIDPNARSGDAVTSRHELVHDLLHHGRRPLPLWIEEGLAEFYSGFGGPIREHASRLRSRNQIAMADMLTMTAADPRATSYDFYAQSWAMVSTLMRRDASAFFEFVADLEAQECPAALRSRYGMSPDDLARALRNAGKPMPILRLDSVEVPVEIRPATRGELLFELGELMARVAGGSEEADRHFTAAFHAGIHDPKMLVRYAEHLLVNGDLAGASSMARHALASGAEPVGAHAVLGLAFALSNDPAAALPHLECAWDARPGDSDIALQLFSIYLASGDRSRANVIFPHLETSPRLNDARRILLDRELSRADQYARHGDVAEAARILRELATRMPARTRSQLEEQAVSLEALVPRP